MKKFTLSILLFFTTIHLQAQTGLQITSACENDSLCLPANECVAIDQTFAISATTDCSTSNIVEYNFFIDWNDDGVVDSLGAASNFTADFPIGTHRVKFTAFDFCGGEENCEFVFEVMDCVAPVIECPTAIDTFYIPSSGHLCINIEEFISINTFDECTNFENLSFSFTQNLADTILNYSCGDVFCEMFEQTIWVTDEAGNQDSCSVNFYVIDIYMPCVFPTSTGIIFKTENWYQETMENVDFLHNGILYYPTINLNLPCGPVVGPENDTVYAHYNVMPLNGVTTFDIVLTSKHILGIEIFDNPYKLIAADVNNSGTVTALDLVIIRSLILNIISEFPTGQSWVFDPEFHIVNYSQNIKYDFIGIKLGDVNGTANPNDFQNNQIDTRTFDGTLNLFAKNQTFKTGETVTITTFAKNFEKIIGGQFTIDFDPSALEFQSIEGNHLIELNEENFGKNNADDGVILCSWNTATAKKLSAKDVFCNITFTAKKDGKLSDYLTINSKKINAEIYVEDGSEIEFWNAELIFEKEKHNNTFTISPNPFSEKTILNFSLEKEGNVELEIFDTNGRLVFSQNKNMPKGENQIEIQKADLPISGIYFYQLKTGIQIHSGKFILF